MAKKKSPARILQVGDQDTAEKLIEQQYKSDVEAEYIVLENAAVFSGEKRAIALKYARKFKWKSFEVKM